MDNKMNLNDASNVTVTDIEIDDINTVADSLVADKTKGTPIKQVEPAKTPAAKVDDKKEPIKADEKVDDEGNPITVTDVKVDDIRDTPPAKDTDEAQTIIDSIIKTIGIEVEGEDGKLKVYADDEAGILEYTQDVISIQANELAQQQQKQFFNQYPAVYRAALYAMQNGGSLEGFQEQVDYSTVQFDEKNEAQHLELVVKNLMRKGVDAKEAQDIATLHKEGGKLKDKASAAYNELITAQKAADAQREAAIRQQRIDEQRNQQAYWNKIGSIIKEGKVGDFTIPKTQQQAFFDYLYTPVNDEGYTQAQIDAAQEDESRVLSFAWMRFNKYDPSKLARDYANKANANTLSQRIQNNKQMSGKSVDMKPATKSFSEINFDSVLDAEIQRQANKSK